MEKQKRSSISPQTIVITEILDSYLLKSERWRPQWIPWSKPSCSQEILVLFICTPVYLFLSHMSRMSGTSCINVKVGKGHPASQCDTKRKRKEEQTPLSRENPILPGESKQAVKSSTTAQCKQTQTHLTECKNHSHSQFGWKTRVASMKTEGGALPIESNASDHTSERAQI